MNDSQSIKSSIPSQHMTNSNMRIAKDFIYTNPDTERSDELKNRAQIQVHQHYPKEFKQEFGTKNLVMNRDESRNGPFSG